MIKYNKYISKEDYLHIKSEILYNKKFTGNKIILEILIVEEWIKLNLNHLNNDEIIKYQYLFRSIIR